jgi:hypothetical protein
MDAASFGAFRCYQCRPVLIEQFWQVTPLLDPLSILVWRFLFFKRHSIAAFYILYLYRKPLII